LKVQLHAEAKILFECENNISVMVTDALLYA
jgi:hypothetical protein